MSEASLSIKLSSWAASELKLSIQPSPAVLEDLVAPPRAAALFTALTDHVRAPQHVLDARMALALQPRKPDSGERGSEERDSLARAKIADMEREASALEVEVKNLRSRIAWSSKRKGQAHRRRRKAVDDHAELQAMKATCAYLLSKEEASMGNAVQIIGDMCRKLSGPKSGNEVAADSVSSALKAMKRASKKLDSSVEGVTQQIDQVVSAVNTTDILQFLSRAAEIEHRRVKFRYCKGADSTPNEEHISNKEDIAVEDDDSVLEEIRLRHMDMFMESEGAIADARELEDEIAATLRHSTPSSEQIAFAQLAGEHAALAELDRIDREYRTYRSSEAVAREAEVQRARFLRARADAASNNLLAQDKILQRLVRECRKLICSSTKSKDALCETLEQDIQNVCGELQSTAKSRLSHAIDRARMVKSLDVNRDAELCIDGTWVPASKVSFLCEEISIDDASDCDFSSTDFVVADAEELELSVSTRDSLNRALERELQRDLMTVRALETRAGLLTDAFERERNSQEQKMCPELEDATEKMNDCVERLVPAADSSIDVWWTQPVREAAPWHKVKGRTLREWELQVVERLTSRRIAGKTSVAKGSSLSQTSSQISGQSGSISSTIQTPDSGTTSSGTASSFTDSYGNFNAHSKQT